jgi:hypothetical protein
MVLVEVGREVDQGHHYDGLVVGLAKLTLPTFVLHCGRADYIVDLAY